MISHQFSIEILKNKKQKMENRFSNKKKMGVGRSASADGRPRQPPFFLIFIGKSIFHFFIFYFKIFSVKIDRDFNWDLYINLILTLFLKVFLMGPQGLIK